MGLGLANPNPNPNLVKEVGGAAERDGLTVGDVGVPLAEHLDHVRVRVRIRVRARVLIQALNAKSTSTMLRSRTVASSMGRW